jgi:hypothetical protein
VYIYTQSIERRRRRIFVNSNRVKDYLIVHDTERKFCGNKSYPERVEIALAKQETGVNLRFVSDFVTMEKLSDPKGFLIYFERKIFLICF